MSAMRQVTITPYRDQAIAALEAAAEDADDLADTCVPCVRALTGWCPHHQEQRARLDEIEPVVMQLWSAENDAEAHKIMAQVPSLTALVDEGSAAAA